MKSVCKLGLLLCGMAAVCSAQTGYGGLGYGLGPFGGTGSAAPPLVIKGGKWGLAGALVGSFKIGPSAAAAAQIACGPAAPAVQLPQIFGDDREVNPPNGTYDVTKTMGIDYTANAAGLNAVILDWTNAPDQWWHVLIPHGALGTTTPLIVTSKVSLLGKVGATKFLVFDSDTPLPEKMTVCSHKTVDNSDGSSPRNFQCTNDKSSMGAIEGQWNSGNNGMLFNACAVGVDANCAVGPNHIAWKNLELRFQAGNTYGGQKVSLIRLNDGDTSGTFGESHIWFKGNYLHGDASEAGTASNNISTMIDWTGCSFCGGAYNYGDQVVSLNNESHIFTNTWSNGPLKFVHNWLEGSSIPFFTGGAGATILPYENVFDLEGRGNRFSHSPAWMLLGGPSLITIKSDSELKTCSRCWIDGNIFEYSNTSGGQKGQCFTLTVRNTSGGASGENYNNSLDNITFTNNICRHAVTGIETSSRSGSASNGGGAAQPGINWNINNDLFYDISPGTGTIVNTTASIPFIVEVGGGGNSWTCTAARDAAGLTATLSCADGGTGLHETTMSVGDLVHVKSCSDSSFNTPLHDTTFAGEGPAALAGTVSFVLSGGSPIPGPIMYPNAGVALATATGCVVSNEQGFQKNFTVRHITAIGGFSGSSGGKGQVPSCGTIDDYALNYTFQDNLIAPLPTQYAGLNCQGDGNTEGTKSEADMADTASFVFNHNALVGRTAASYTDWPGAVSPSTGNWFPATPWCPVGTVDFTTCFAFNGMMSTTTYEANATDYHDYVLNSSSVFKAGGSRQASDGTAVGADISAIDLHLNATQAICPVAGGTGPFPD